MLNMTFSFRYNIDNGRSATTVQKPLYPPGYPGRAGGEVHHPHEGGGEEGPGQGVLHDRAGTLVLH